MQTGAQWIGKEWLVAPSQASAESVSPATGEVVGKVPFGGRAEAQAAIAAARDAFDHSAWSQSPRLRAEVMFQVCDIIDSRADKIARILSFETGKLLKVARIELAALTSEMRYYAGLVRALSGRVIEVGPGQYSLLLREPAGVAGIIVPWNAPGILLARSLGPAMAVGCTTVLKPASQSTLFHTAVMECFREVDRLPPGVVNSVSEVGIEASQEIVRSADVDVISYTGSSKVGKQIMADAAATLKRLVLELGGKAPAIILEDADLDVAIPKLAAAGMILCGQQCTAVNRVLVVEPIYKKVVEALSHALASMKVGHIDRDETELGPMINRASRDRIDRLVGEAEGMGRAILRGRPLGDGFAAGAYQQPSLISVEDPNSHFVQEEFFGPVVNIEMVSDDADAVRKANATRYGLSASVWTRDLARAHRLARTIKSGTVWINDHNRLIPEVETGGRGDSGIGRLHGVEGLNEFLETKHVFQDHGAPIQP